MCSSLIDLFVKLIRTFCIHSTINDYLFDEFFVETSCEACASRQILENAFACSIMTWSTHLPRKISVHINWFQMYRWWSRFVISIACAVALGMARKVPRIHQMRRSCIHYWFLKTSSHLFLFPHSLFINFSARMIKNDARLRNNESILFHRRNIRGSSKTDFWAFLLYTRWKALLSLVRRFRCSLFSMLHLIKNRLTQILWCS